jgi:hypothetical protein
VLIWDATTQAPSTANNCLPEALCGQTIDTDLTLVVILHKRSVRIANYEFRSSVVGNSDKAMARWIEGQSGLRDVNRRILLK